MKNLWVIPTDKPSRLYKHNELGFELLAPVEHEIGAYNGSNQHLYITSDKEITGFEHNIWVIKGERIFLWQNTMALVSDNKPRKIILTTDVDLIKDGVQAIDDEFLEWFVKNIDCESVKVERLDTFKKTNEVYVDEIAGGNYYEIIKQYKIIIPQEETKQETLEKVAKKQWGNVHRTGVLGFIDGVKSDAARDYWFEKFKAEWYNEEEVRKLLIMQRGNSYVAILTKTKDEELARIASTAPEPGGKDGWVKQFKKK
jgi:hypothetical protein